jgi:glyoxylase-like metal-dependent hydrolase (beta-lactamase superfamily II)
VTLEDTHRIALPTPFRVGPVNVYLLEGDPLTLIDAGPLWPPALAALEAGLAEVGHALEEIELLLLTHQHVDHVGLAAQIRSRSAARVAAIANLGSYLDDFPATWEADDEFAEQVMHHYGTPADRIRAIRELSASFSRYAERVAVDVRLADGEEIEAGGRRLRVVTRPGHSPTDTVYVDEARRSAFVGDHVLSRISSNPVIHRPLGGDTSVGGREPTLARYLDSLARTRALDLASLMPGHGDVTTEPRALIDLRIRHHQERKETIAELIADGRRTVPQLVETLWGDVETSQIYLALSEVVGHTDLLVEEGRLAEVRDGGAVRFEPARRG